MTQVDFHILSSDQRSAQLEYTCRLTEKVANQGRTILIYTDNEAVTSALDEKLWAFRPESFVPHTTDINTSANIPVYITHEQDPGSFHDVLVTVHGGVPPEFFSQFERVLEIVIQEPQFLSQSRDNFKFYRSRGYDIRSHKVGH